MWPLPLSIDPVGQITRRETSKGGKKMDAACACRDPRRAGSSMLVERWRLAGRRDDHALCAHSHTSMYRDRDGGRARYARRGDWGRAGTGTARCAADRVRRVSGRATRLAGTVAHPLSHAVHASGICSRYRRDVAGVDAARDAHHFGLQWLRSVHSGDVLRAAQRRGTAHRAAAGPGRGDPTCIKLILPRMAQGGVDRC